MSDKIITKNNNEKQKQTNNFHENILYKEIMKTRIWNILSYTLTTTYSYGLHCVLVTLWQCDGRPVMITYEVGTFMVLIIARVQITWLGGMTEKSILVMQPESMWEGTPLTAVRLCSCFFSSSSQVKGHSPPIHRTKLLHLLILPECLSKK